MADRKASGPAKSKEASGKAVCRLIRRFSTTKRYQGSPVTATSSSSLNFGASSSRKQEALGKDSSPKPSKSFEESKMSLNLESKSSSSSKSSLSSFSMPSPSVTPTQSNQSLNTISSEEFKVLSQLHANFGDNNNFLGQYLSLRNQKK